MPTDWERLRVIRDFGSLSARSEALDWLRGTPAVTAGVAGVTGRLSPLAVQPPLTFGFGAGVAAAVRPEPFALLVSTAFGIVKLAASYSLPLTCAEARGLSWSARIAQGFSHKMVLTSPYAALPDGARRPS